MSIQRLAEPTPAPSSDPAAVVAGPPADVFLRIDLPASLLGNNHVETTSILSPYDLAAVVPGASVDAPLEIDQSANLSDKSHSVCASTSPSSNYASVVPVTPAVTLAAPSSSLAAVVPTVRADVSLGIDLLHI